MTDQKISAKKATSKVRGNLAERIALKYLKSQGLKKTQCNYFCRHGEIDIVMQDADYVVFVEVRYRQTDGFGSGLESVDSYKQKKLRTTAQHYLLSNKLTDIPCRFDILSMCGSLKKPSIDWIKNAF